MPLACFRLIFPYIYTYIEYTPLCTSPVTVVDSSRAGITGRHFLLALSINITGIKDNRVLPKQHLLFPYFSVEFSSAPPACILVTDLKRNSPINRMKACIN